MRITDQHLPDLEIILGYLEGGKETYHVLQQYAPSKLPDLTISDSPMFINYAFYDKGSLVGTLSVATTERSHVMGPASMWKDDIYPFEDFLDDFYEALEAVTKALNL